MLNDAAASIFSLDRVQFDLSTRLVCASVSNNVLVLALENNHVLRIDLQQASAIDNVELPRKAAEARVRRVFCDPTGRHVLISTEQGENYYLFEAWQKPKLLSKLKNLMVESVAWNKAAVKSSRNSTLSILLGTQDGRIFETEIEPTEEFFRREEKYLRLIYTLPEPAPVAGLHYEAFPATPRKYFVLAVTPHRIYQFVGLVDVRFAGGSALRGADEGPTPAVDHQGMFEALFAQYTTQPVFQEIPGSLGHSALCLFSRLQDVAYQSVAEKFAWLTGAGVYHGQLVYGSQGTGDSVVSDPVLLPYPHEPGPGASIQPEVPLAMALTEFHVLLLYRTSVKAVCLLNDQVVLDEPVPLAPGETTVGLHVDTVHNTYWVFTPSSIFELIIQDEDRDVWRIYLKKRMYDTAFQHAKTTTEKDLILEAQADHYYAQGRYVLSASYYAQTARAFEEVALKFVHQGDQEALKCYLTKKLDHLKKGNLTQITLLSTWLVEIYLNQLNCFDSLLKARRSDDPAHSATQEERDGVLSDFYDLLRVHRRHMDRRTTYGLFRSHGRHAELLHYSALLGDYDQVVAHWLRERDYPQAVDVLSRHGTPALFYKFAPSLLRWSPEALVPVLMRQPDLDPRQLIPAFLKYQEARGTRDSQNQVIRYLTFLIRRQGSRDPVLHNFLLAVYATQPAANEAALLEFLAHEGPDMCYDVDYALRVCRQHHRIQSCVHLHGLLGQYEDAVDLALRHEDLDLAQINADKPADDPDLRRRLWLKIARHVIETTHDVRRAMALLSACPLLTVEQILPFFPDFTQIDDFKEEICTALEDYDRHVHGLRTEMDEATRNARAIQEDIRHLRNRFVLVAPGERCGLCDAPLLARQFYAFPCQHTFHADCLVRKVTAHMLPRRRRRVADCQQQITRQLMARGTEQAGSGTGHQLAQLKRELDGLVASECVLCGEMMIKTIDKVFVDEGREQELAATWEV
ncbi:tethering complex subunit [Tieghemiomyces parasiticus]|uniref:Tethering complex subunit n=1 Tax=Tieghemiomyces parasiticus TaxID=78921 RepID=A0A9W8A229_9FUNG|nr:tethering complex subunit [Tieghemiomyces parasiticus]